MDIAYFGLSSIYLPYCRKHHSNILSSVVLVKVMFTVAMSKHYKNVFLTHVMVSYGCAWLPLSHSEISASPTFLTLISSKFQESSPFSWQVGKRERIKCGMMSRFSCYLLQLSHMNAPSCSYPSLPHVQRMLTPPQKRLIMWLSPPFFCSGMGTCPQLVQPNLDSRLLLSGWVAYSSIM